MTARVAWVLLSALLSPACSDARQGCLFDDDRQVAKSETFSGSFVLDADSEPERFAFEANLSDLPELWATERPIEAGLLLEVQVRYVDATLAADESIEMPRTTVSVTTSVAITGPRELTRELQTRAALFLDAADNHSCKPGSRSCADSAQVVIERQDLAPFPAVEVTWSITAQASVNDCPLEHSQVRLELKAL